MDIKGHADFSSYILFEATGDSENAYEFGRVDDHDDDDALSCCYDESDACDIASELNMHDESCDDDEHDGEKIEDEEKDDAYGASYCEDDEMQEQYQKSYVSSDSSQEEFVDEMEKDRLFWEACLAS